MYKHYFISFRHTTPENVEFSGNFNYVTRKKIRHFSDINAIQKEIKHVLMLGGHKVGNVVIDDYKIMRYSFRK